MTRRGMKIFVLLEALIGLSCVTANTLPSWVQKQCKVSDSQCMSERVVEYGPIFAKGVPELGVEPMDPMKVKDVTLSNPGIEISFKEAILTGLRNFKLNRYKAAPDGKKITIDIVANVTLKCQYKMDGQILVLPIKGEGAGKIRLKDLNIIIHGNTDNIKKNDVTYHAIVNYKYDYKVSRGIFKLEGLFGGNNKVLSDTTNKFLNDNWEVFIYDIAKPVVTAIVDQVITTIKAFAYAIPYSELYLQ